MTDPIEQYEERIKDLEAQVQIQEFRIDDQRKTLEVFREFDNDEDCWALLKEQRDTARAEAATLTAQRDRLLEAAKEAQAVLWGYGAAYAEERLGDAIREIEAAPTLEGMRQAGWDVPSTPGDAQLAAENAADLEKLEREIEAKEQSQ